jgi:GNAT superfamily N-acetyltransferase
MAVAQELAEAGKGYGKSFAAFYEEYAREHGCIDTNVRNTRARHLYQKLGYKEEGIVGCVFNGIPDVQLVCMEKYLG